MSILGLGFDATDIPRVREVFERYGDRFLRRVFTDGEIAYCTRHRDPVPQPGRPLRRQGSDDEGARHRALARRRSGRTSRCSATAVRRNCG